MTKRTLVLLLATSVLLAITGCGKSAEPSSIEESQDMDKDDEEENEDKEDNADKDSDVEEAKEDSSEDAKDDDKNESKKEKGSLPDGWTWGGDIYADSDKKVVYQTLSDDWQVAGSYSALLKTYYGDSSDYHVTEFQYRVDNTGHWTIEENINSNKQIYEEEAAARGRNADNEKCPENVYETSYDTSYGPVYVILSYTGVGETVHFEGVAPIVAEDGSQVDGFMQFQILEEALGDSDEKREEWANYVSGLTDESLKAYLSTYINALK